MKKIFIVLMGLFLLGVSYADTDFIPETIDDLEDGVVNSIISKTQESQYDQAYGWGDHALEGYLTAETDPVYSAWDKSSGISITESQISDFGTYLETETDPVSLHLDQTTPQTFSAGAVSGTGLLKVTSGALGLDESVYLSGTGTSGYLSYWSSSSTIGTSSLFYDLVNNVIKSGDYEITDSGEGISGISNGDLLDDDCTTLTGWTQVQGGDTYTTVTQQTFDSKSTFKLSVTKSAGLDYVGVRRYVSYVSGDATLSTDFYIDSLEQPSFAGHFVYINIEIMVSTTKAISLSLQQGYDGIYLNGTKISSSNLTLQTWNTLGIIYHSIDNNFDVYLGDTALSTGRTDFTTRSDLIGRTTVQVGCVDNDDITVYINDIKAGSAFAPATTVPLTDVFALVSENYLSPNLNETNCSKAIITEGYVEAGNVISRGSLYVDTIDTDTAASLAINADTVITGDSSLDGNVNINDIYDLPQSGLEKDYAMSSMGDELLFNNVREYHGVANKGYSANKLLKIGFMTDLHWQTSALGITYAVTEDAVHFFIDTMNAQRLDCVVDGGDSYTATYADRHYASGIESLMEYLTVPLYSVIGNHEIGNDPAYLDLMKDYYTYVTDHPEYYYKDINGVRLIFLSCIYSTNASDTYLTFDELGETDVAGYVGATQLAWLSDLLDNTTLPVVVFSHYDLAEAYATDVINELVAFEVGGGDVIACFAGHRHDNDFANYSGAGYDFDVMRFPAYNQDETDPSYAIITIDKEDIDSDGDYYYVEGEGLYIDRNGAPPVDSVYFELNVGIGTTAPTEKFQVGDATNNTQISNTGDVIFNGSGGLVFGEIYGNDTDTTLTISGSGIANKVQITSFNVDGLSNSMTPDHTNDHITITKAGVYLCTLNVSLESTGAGTGAEIGVSVFKNNGATEFTNVHSHRRLSGGGVDIGNIAIAGIIDLAVNDTIEVWLWNETNTEDVIINDATLSLVEVAGT